MSSMNTDTDKTYNGWANYPTWCVNLWLSNDQGTYNEVRGIAEDLTDGYEPDQYSTEGVPRQVADEIKRFVTEDLAPDLGASFAADLLGYALDEVDWIEIADAWIEED